MGPAVILFAVAAVLAMAGLSRRRNASALEAARTDAIRQRRDGVKQVTEQLQMKDAERLEQARATDEALAGLLARLHQGVASRSSGPTARPDFVVADAAEAADAASAG